MDGAASVPEPAVAGAIGALYCIAESADANALTEPLMTGENHVPRGGRDAL